MRPWKKKTNNATYSILYKNYVIVYFNNTYQFYCVCSIIIALKCTSIHFSPLEKWKGIILCVPDTHFKFICEHDIANPNNINQLQGNPSIFTKFRAGRDGTIDGQTDRQLTGHKYFRSILENIKNVDLYIWSIHTIEKSGCHW